MRRFKALIFMIMVLFFTEANAQQVHIDIEAGGFRKFKVAMPTYAGAPDMAGPLWAVCAKDLQMSGIFDVIPSQSYVNPGPMAEVQPGTLKDWSLIGADYVITASVSRQGQSGLLKVQVTELGSAQVLMANTYTTNPETMYMAVHSFMNSFLKDKFGLDGIFSSKIVAIKKEKGQKQLYTAWCDGTGGSTIKTGGNLVLGPKWSPDGKKIAFVSYYRNNPDLYLFDLTTNSLKTISSQKGINTSPAFDATGKKIACTLSIDGNPEIYLLDLNGGGKTRVTSSFAIDTSPVFSPDGNRMVFCSSRAGTPQIYSMDLTTKNVLRLSYQGVYNSEPAYSPKGDLIAFSTQEKGGRFHIALVRPDGSNFRVLPGTGLGDESPTFSPDGRLIAFAASDGNIYVTDLFGTSPVKVTNGGAFSEPNWSPLKM